MTDAGNGPAGRGRLSGLNAALYWAKSLGPGRQEAIPVDVAISFITCAIAWGLLVGAGMLIFKWLNK